MAIVKKAVAAKPSSAKVVQKKAVAPVQKSVATPAKTAVVSKPVAPVQRAAVIPKELTDIRALVATFGLTVSEEILLKVKPEGRAEILKEKIVDFLKSEYEDLREKYAQGRKQGTDHFIEEMMMLRLASKQKIALSTFEKKDIQKYLKDLNVLKNS